MTTTEDIAYLQQLNQQVQDNLAYRSTNSLAKARLLIEAIEGLIVFRPSEARGGGVAGESVRFDLATLREMKRDVEKWLSGRNVAANQYTYLEYCEE